MKAIVDRKNLLLVFELELVVVSIVIVIGTSVVDSSIVALVVLMVTGSVVVGSKTQKSELVVA